jgi:hypothetical protein
MPVKPTTNGVGQAFTSIRAALAIPVALPLKPAYSGLQFFACNSQHFERLMVSGISYVAPDSPWPPPLPALEQWH